MALLFALPAGAAACTSTANVDDAYMALDSSGQRKRNIFFTDTVAIYCVAEFASSRADVTLNVKLHQLSRYDFTANQIVGFDAFPTEVEIAPGATARSQQDLLLVKADAKGVADDRLPYQAGDYQCEIYLDGQKEKTVKFSIQFPPCPDTRITPGSTCLGFYRLGDRCPELGAGSTNPANCTCNTVQGPMSDSNLTGGNWSCDAL